MRLDIIPVMVSEEQIKNAANDLDQHVEEMINWHFSPESGCPFWLNWAKEQDFNPLKEVRTFAELCNKFPYFKDEWLRDLPNKAWVPQAFADRPFNIFETGGTTGMPKQRIGWDDFRIDYTAFSKTRNDEHFPRDHYWLMVGPTGPRRLRLAIEHLANERGCSCYFGRFEAP